MLIVKRNTFPRYPNVAHAEVGDIVEWRGDGANKSGLYRTSDNGTFAKCLWSRTRQSRFHEFKQPPVGIICQNKSKGYILELEEIQESLAWQLGNINKKNGGG